MDLPLNQILVGDVIEKLKELPEGCVHTCVTSPPYWGLRDYGVPGQIGLEPEPSKYVEKIVEVFRGVKRVLRYDGTLWLNLGDSYVGAMSQHRDGGSQGKNSCIAKKTMSGIPTNGRIERNKNLRGIGLKPKDLVGIPWRVAFALQADGWWLRSDIIWQKPNPMPESVTDRPTKAHEYVFLLAKSERYFYDAAAIMEKNSLNMIERAAKGHTRGAHGKLDASRNDEDTLRGEDAKVIEANGRNRRSVWTVATEPFPDAHFAVFPESLIEPCILAGTSEGGCCAACGAPWSRLVEKTKVPDRPNRNQEREGDSLDEAHGADGRAGDRWALSSKTLGWEPSCSCGKEERNPGVVLDPFMGSGTTALVALKALRKFIGIELNPEYAELAKSRIGPEISQMRLL